MSFGGRLVERGGWFGERGSFWEEVLVSQPVPHFFYTHYFRKQCRFLQRDKGLGKGAFWEEGLVS